MLATGRWLVRMDDDATEVNIKPKNLTFVGAPKVVAKRRRVRHKSPPDAAKKTDPDAERAVPEQAAASAIAEPAPPHTTTVIAKPAPPDNTTVHAGPTPPDNTTVPAPHAGPAPPDNTTMLAPPYNTTAHADTDWVPEPLPPENPLGGQVADGKYVPTRLPTVFTCFRRRFLVRESGQIRNGTAKPLVIFYLQQKQQVQISPKECGRSITAAWDVAFRMIVNMRKGLIDLDKHSLHEVKKRYVKEYAEGINIA